MLLCLLAACAPASTPTPTAAPSGALLIAQAPQSDPPALYLDNERITAVWIDEDSVGVHQAARVIDSGVSGEVVVLPLPPQQPRAQSLHPTTGDRLRLLWLDSENGETRLFSAVLSADLRVERGPTRVSTARTLRYAAAPGADERLWAVWLGGVVSEPNLYIQSLDSEGRPQLPRMFAAHVVDFALAAAADGSLYVFWIDGGDGAVYGTHVRDGETLNARRLTSGVSLAAGDMLDALRAGLDASNGYLFWNISRADGTSEVWMTFGGLASDVWLPPARLSTGDSEVRRAAPLAAEQMPLPVAVETESGLWLLSFGGAVALSETPIALGARLVAPPALYMNDDGRLLAAWADAASADAAALYAQWVK